MAVIRNATDTGAICNAIEKEPFANWTARQL